MNNFPLYNNLSKDIPKKDLSVKEKQEFMTKVENIDDIGKDLLCKRDRNKTFHINVNLFELFMYFI